jgi:hypothetical protein
MEHVPCSLGWALRSLAHLTQDGAGRRMPGTFQAEPASSSRAERSGERTLTGWLRGCCSATMMLPGWVLLLSGREFLGAQGLGWTTSLFVCQQGQFAKWMMHTEWDGVAGGVVRAEDELILSPAGCHLKQSITSAAVSHLYIATNEGGLQCHLHIKCDA